MRFAGPLQPATLIRRYKRFLADVLTPGGEALTLHCPNTGRMTGCAEPGWQVWYSRSANPGRKYPCTWELTRNEAGEWIGVNTGRANALVAEAIGEGRIVQLAGYGQLEREVRYGSEGSRIDLRLRQPGRPDCYVEVKSVTLLDQDGVGRFPDAPSVRAVRHLRELMRMVAQGERAMVLFCVQHSGIRQVSAAEHIDPDYARQLAEAAAAGVELLAWGCQLSPEGIVLSQPLPVTACQTLRDGC